MAQGAVHQPLLFSSGEANIQLLRVPFQPHISSRILQPHRTTRPDSRTSHLLRTICNSHFITTAFYHPYPGQFGSRDGLCLHETIFGWVLVGKQNKSTNSFFISCHASIDEILRTFWEVQTLPQKRLPTEEELQRKEYVKSIFQETTIVGDHLVELDAPDKDFHCLP